MQCKQLRHQRLSLQKRNCYSNAATIISSTSWRPSDSALILDIVHPQLWHGVKHTIWRPVGDNKVSLVSVKVSNNLFCSSLAGDISLYLYDAFNWGHGLQINCNNARDDSIPA